MDIYGVGHCLDCGYAYTLPQFALSSDQCPECCAHEQARVSAEIERAVSDGRLVAGTEYPDRRALSKEEK